MNDTKTMQVRLPENLKNWLVERAESNNRSQNSELIAVLQFAQSLDGRILIDSENEAIVAGGAIVPVKDFIKPMEELGYEVKKKTGYSIMGAL